MQQAWETDKLLFVVFTPQKIWNPHIFSNKGYQKTKELMNTQLKSCIENVGEKLGYPIRILPIPN